MSVVQDAVKKLKKDVTKLGKEITDNMGSSNKRATSVSTGNVSSQYAYPISNTNNSLGNTPITVPNNNVSNNPRVDLNPYAVRQTSNFIKRNYTNYTNYINDHTKFQNKFGSTLYGTQSAAAQARMKANEDLNLDSEYEYSRSEKGILQKLYSGNTDSEIAKLSDIQYTAIQLDNLEKSMAKEFALHGDSVKYREQKARYDNLKVNKLYGSFSNTLLNKDTDYDSYIASGESWLDVFYSGDSELLNSFCKNSGDYDNLITYFNNNFEDAEVVDYSTNKLVTYPRIKKDAEFPYWVEPTDENKYAWEFYTNYIGVTQDVLTNDFKDNYQPMLDSSGSRIPLGTKDISESFSDKLQRTIIDGSIYFDYGNSGKNAWFESDAEDGVKSYLDIVNHFFQDAKNNNYTIDLSTLKSLGSNILDYKKDYLIKPLLNGKFLRVGGNLLYNLFEVMDLAGRSARGFVGGETAIGGTDHFDGQNEYWFKDDDESKELQKIFINNGGYGLLMLDNPNYAVEHKQIYSNEDAFELRKQLRKAFDDAGYLNYDWSEIEEALNSYYFKDEAYKNGAFQQGLINATAGVYSDGDTYAWEGNVASAMIIETVLDPTFVIGGVARSLVSSNVDNTIRIATDNAINTAFRSENVDYAIEYFANNKNIRRAFKEFRNTNNSYNIIFKSEEALNKDIETLWIRLQPELKNFDIDSEEFLSKFKDVILDESRSMNAKVVANSAVGRKVINDKTTKLAYKVSSASDAIDTALLKASFPEPFILRNTYKALKSNIPAGKLGSFYFARKLAKSVTDEVKIKSSLVLPDGMPTKTAHVKGLENCDIGDIPGQRKILNSANDSLARLTSDRISGKVNAAEVENQINNIITKLFPDSRNQTLDEAINSWVIRLSTDVRGTFIKDIDTLKKRCSNLRTITSYNNSEVINNVVNEINKLPVDANYFDNVVLTIRDHNLERVSDLDELLVRVSDIYSSRSGETFDLSYAKIYEGIFDESILDTRYIDETLSNVAKSTRGVINKQHYVDQSYVITRLGKIDQGLAEDFKKFFKGFGDAPVTSRQFAKFIDNNCIHALGFANDTNIMSIRFNELVSLKQDVLRMTSTLSDYRFVEEFDVYRLNKTNEFFSTVEDIRFKRLMNKWESDIKPLFESYQKVQENHEDKTIEGVLGALNSLNESFNHINQFYGLRQVLIDSDIPDSESSAILDSIFGITSDETSLLNAVELEYGSYSNFIRSTLYNSFKDYNLGVNRFRKDLLHTDILNTVIPNKQYAEEIQNSPELRNWIDSLVHSDESDPKSYLDLQILQMFLYDDGHLVRDLNNQSEYGPVIFVHTSTTGLDYLNDNVTGIACKEWKSIPEEDVNLSYIKSFIESDEGSERYLVNLTEEELDGLDSRVFNSVYNESVSQAGSDTVSRKNAYANTFVREGDSVSEIDIIEDFSASILKKLSISKATNSRPVFITHDLNNYNMKFLRNSINANAELYGLSNTVELSDIMKRPSTFTYNTYKELRSVVNTHELTDEQIDFVADLLKSFMRDSTTYDYRCIQHVTDNFNTVLDSAATLVNDSNTPGDLKRVLLPFFKNQDEYRELSEVADYVVKNTDYVQSYATNNAILYGSCGLGDSYIRPGSTIDLKINGGSANISEKHKLKDLSKIFFNDDNSRSAFLSYTTQYDIEALTQKYKRFETIYNSLGYDALNEVGIYADDYKILIKSIKESLGECVYINSSHPLFYITQLKDSYEDPLELYAISRMLYEDFLQPLYKAEGLVYEGEVRTKAMVSFAKNRAFNQDILDSIPERLAKANDYLESSEERRALAIYDILYKREAIAKSKSTIAEFDAELDAYKDSVDSQISEAEEFVYESSLELRNKYQEPYDSKLQEVKGLKTDIHNSGGVENLLEELNKMQSIAEEDKIYKQFVKYNKYFSYYDYKANAALAKSDAILEDIVSLFSKYNYSIVKGSEEQSILNIPEFISYLTINGYDSDVTNLKNLLASRKYNNTVFANVYTKKHNLKNDIEIFRSKYKDMFSKYGKDLEEYVDSTPDRHISSLIDDDQLISDYIMLRNASTYNSDTLETLQSSRNSFINELLTDDSLDSVDRYYNSLIGEQEKAIKKVLNEIEYIESTNPNLFSKYGANLEAYKQPDELLIHNDTAYDAIMNAPSQSEYDILNEELKVLRQNLFDARNAYYSLRKDFGKLKYDLKGSYFQKKYDYKGYSFIAQNEIAYNKRGINIAKSRLKSAKKSIKQAKDRINHIYDLQSKCEKAISPKSIYTSSGSFSLDSFYDNLIKNYEAVGYDSETGLDVLETMALSNNTYYKCRKVHAKDEYSQYMRKLDTERVGIDVSTGELIDNYLGIMQQELSNNQRADEVLASAGILNPDDYARGLIFDNASKLHTSLKTIPEELQEVFPEFVSSVRSSFKDIQRNMLLDNITDEDGVYNIDKLTTQLLWNGVNTYSIPLSFLRIEEKDGSINNKSVDMLMAFLNNDLDTKYFDMYVDSVTDECHVYIKKGFSVHSYNVDGVEYRSLSDGISDVVEGISQPELLNHGSYVDIASNRAYSRFISSISEHVPSDVLPLFIRQYSDIADNISNVYSDIYNLSKGSSINILGKRLSKNDYFNYYNRLPRAVRENMEVLTDVGDSLRSDVVFDPGFINCETMDPISDCFSTLKEYASRKEELDVLVNSVFGKGSQTSFNDFVRDFSDDEVFDFLNRKSDIAVISLAPDASNLTGYTVRLVDTSTKLNVSRARQLGNTIIVPYDFYSVVSDMCSRGFQHNEAVKVINRLLSLNKKISLINPMTYLNNLIEAYTRAIASSGDGFSSIPQLTRYIFDAHKKLNKLEELHRVYGDVVSSGNWKNICKRFDIPDMSYEEYQYLNGLTNKYARNKPLSQLSDKEMLDAYTNLRRNKRLHNMLSPDEFSSMLKHPDTRDSRYYQSVRAFTQEYKNVPLSVLDRSINLGLQPMNIVEQGVRYAQFRYAMDRGSTAVGAAKNVIFTQADIPAADTLLYKLDKLFPFIAFRYNQVLYYFHLMEENPEYYRYFMHTQGTRMEHHSLDMMEDREYNEKDPIMQGKLQLDFLGLDGMYLNTNPGFNGALSTFYGLPAEAYKSLQSTAKTAVKYSMFELGLSNKSYFNEFNIGEYDVSSDLVKAVPVISALYQRMNIRTKVFKEPFDVLNVLVNGVIGIDYHNYMYDSTSFDTYQEELNKQGLWYDGNTHEIVSLSDKNEYGLNDPNMTFHDRQAYMLYHFGLIWDSNVGKFVKASELSSGGLNQTFDFTKDSDAWQKLCDAYESRLGLVWDANIRKFVKPEDKSLGGLNEDFDFENDPGAWDKMCNLYAELFDMHWDANQNTFVKSDQYISGGMNDANAFNYKYYRKALYGEEKVNGEWVKTSEPEIILLQQQEGPSTDLYNNYYYTLGIARPGFSDLSDSHIENGLIVNSKGQYILINDEAYKNKLFATVLGNVSSKAGYRSYNKFKNYSYNNTQVSGKHAFTAGYTGHLSGVQSSNESFQFSYNYNYRNPKPVTSVKRMYTTRINYPFGGGYNKYSFYIR